MQRTFLARALVSGPELLLLDEPTADVDVKTRDDVMQISLFDLNSDGVTILLTTHRINGVAVSLPRIICINGTINSGRTAGRSNHHGSAEPGLRR